jgi:hypothetical protein
LNLIAASGTGIASRDRHTRRDGTGHRGKGQCQEDHRK